MVLSRRSLLKGAAAVGVSAGLFVPGLLSEEEIEARRKPKKKKRKVFRLDPTYICPPDDRRPPRRPPGVGVLRRDPKPKTCEACTACFSHAKHKFFIDPPTADDNRAHDGCLCGVVAENEEVKVWEGMFGCRTPGNNARKKKPKFRDVFDDRIDTAYPACT